MKTSYTVAITPKKLNVFFKRTPLMEIHLKLVALMFLILTLTSCSSDDGADVVNGDNGDTGDSVEEVTIVETWNLSSATLATAKDFNEDGTASTDLVTETNCQLNSIITLKSDGTGTWKIFNALFILYDEAADTYEPICDSLDETTGLFALEWTKTGNNRSFTYTGTNASGTQIGIISGSNLSVPFVLPIMTDDGQGGVVLYFEQNGTSVFDLQ